MQAAFYASAGAGLLGLLLTVFFLPDTTGLDLHEIDRWGRAGAARQGAPACLPACLQSPPLHASPCCAALYRIPHVSHCPLPAE